LLCWEEKISWIIHFDLTKEDEKRRIKSDFLKFPHVFDIFEIRQIQKPHYIPLNFHWNDRRKMALQTWISIFFSLQGSSSTCISYIEMVAQPIVPQGAFWPAASFLKQLNIHFTVYPGDNGDFLRAPEIFPDIWSSLIQLDRCWPQCERKVRKKDFFRYWEGRSHVDPTLVVPRF